MASPDLFDAYFRRADTDRDGRISGQEAVAFFQGTNLPREVLAKIWQFADQGQTGFLSRAEFYNALKLVTVAQTGRELTPALVSKALTGPAASQIPPPQVQFPAGSTPAAVPPQGAARPVRPPGQSMPHYPQYPTSGSLPSGPRPMPSTPVPRPSAPITGAPTPALSEWPTSKSSSWPGPGFNNTVANQPSKPSSPAQDMLRAGSFSSGSATNTGAPKTTSGAEPDLFGGDVFTAVPVKNSAVPSSTQLTPVTAQVAQPGMSPMAQAPQQRASFSIVPTSGAPNMAPKPMQAAPNAVQPSLPGADGIRSWPKMTDAIVRRYTKIFFEVDTDKDGKISGNQARDLFLSWHLPREVLKQIWDLSDQDRDSMLSLREFCVALYLMERHREGRALPAAIPTAFYFDESGAQALRISEAQVAVSLNSAGYNLPSWNQNPSTLQPSAPGLPPRPISPSPLMPGQAPVRTPMPAVSREGILISHPAQLKSRSPGLEMNLVNQLPADDQLTLQTKHQDAADSEKKMQEVEKRIMDSKEKMEYYRSKLQDIVLFKTRCDNRLAEITDRAAADKREVEALVKRYEEKYKQAGEVQSKLLADEAAFRDIQERRLELYNAILRMDQGGDTNALLQVRADRLQTDLDELKKALNAKCKQFGLRVKPTSILELPYGWQPGIQENAAQWDDDWDKFEDEGFVYVQEFMEEGTAGHDAAKPRTTAEWDESGQLEDGFDPSHTNGDATEEPPSNGNGEPSSPQAEHDDVSRNGDSHDDNISTSPAHSESGIFSTKTNKESERHTSSPTPSESEAFTANGGDWASAFSHKSDDTESHASWGKSETTTKAFDESSFKDHNENMFGFGDPFSTKDLQEGLPSFGPIRTKERTSVFFDNSVPSTPLDNNSTSHFPTGSFFDESVPNTPLQSVSRGQMSSTDNFFRFDSFSSSTHENPSESFARFDSFSSSAGTHTRGFSAFDDADPFSGTGPFGGGQTPRRSTDSTWSAFS